MTDSVEERVRVTQVVLDRHAGMEGAALPVLHEIHAALGFVPAEAIPIVAHALNRSRAEIHGVVTFYHDFRAAPPGRHVVKLCQAEACQSMGSAAVAAAVAQRLGIALGQSSADGQLTLEPVYCLGLCACAPAAMVDGEVLGRLDADAIEDIAQAVRR
ncbi:MAG TPA: formate dehydrogenase subunit gamma [Roseomonas sp.]|jgi:formate dehydrogenase subunit gamma